MLRHAGSVSKVALYLYTFKTAATDYELRYSYGYAETQLNLRLVRPPTAAQFRKIVVTTK